MLFKKRRVEYNNIKNKYSFLFSLTAVLTKIINSADISTEDNLPERIAKSLNAIKIQVPNM